MVRGGNIYVLFLVFLIIIVMFWGIVFLMFVNAFKIRTFLLSTEFLFFDRFLDLVCLILLKYNLIGWIIELVQYIINNLIWITISVTICLSIRFWVIFHYLLWYYLYWYNIDIFNHLLDDVGIVLVWLYRCVVITRTQLACWGLSASLIALPRMLNRVRAIVNLTLCKCLKILKSFVLLFILTELKVVFILFLIWKGILLVV